MPKKPKTGWNKPNRKKRKYQSNYTRARSIKFSAGTMLIERFLKYIIYGILRISIPKYIKSSAEKSHQIVNETYNKLNSPEFAFIPSGFALYLFMSFIPVLTIVSTIGYINEDYRLIINFILSKIIPGIQNVVPSLFSKVQEAGKGEVFIAIVFVLSTFWISSSGYAKFVQSNSILYEHKDLGNIFKNRIKGIWIVICLTAILFIAFLIVSSFLYFLKTSAGYNFGDWQFVVVFYLTLPVLIFTFMTLAYVLLYHYAPLFKLKYSYIMPGVMISVIPTSVFVIIFGFLTSLIDYRKFGVLSSFMYIQLFLLTMSYFTYTGVLINASFYKTFISLQTVPKKMKHI